MVKSNFHPLHPRQRGTVKSTFGHSGMLLAGIQEDLNN
ncbi:hypothetical protein ASZ90_006470 [hydrocarbon metagenome]|uniref:Uncharacterized protein n=1 Tax=hydrocarbon metagenome TaxID=938273 RepID=A0A0W8FSM0_9ZZZZ